jgi:CubicO group peptidase (beta-lactamase class C family)
VEGWQMGQGEASQSVFPGEHWDTLDAPASVGWDVEKLAEARGTARGAGSTAMMVIHRGRVVTSYGRPERISVVASVRKSLLSALYGIHVAAGTIDTSTTLAELGIDDWEPALTAEEKRATIGDLLRSRSGIYHPAASTTDWERSQKPPRGSHTPGTYWSYNNWDFNTLGTIFEQLVGRSLFVDFKERIADEIGMQDYKPEHGRYIGQYYSKHLAYHFHMSARDLARFGLLYLHGGSWNGKQIVPSVWVAESTRRHSWTSSGLGYGYMWWVGLTKPFRTVAEEHSFAAKGYRGQLVHVFPDLDLIFVHRYAASSDEDTGIPERTILEMLNLVLEAHPGDGSRVNGSVGTASVPAAQSR